MRKDLFDLDIEEFTRLLCNKEKVYELKNMLTWNSDEDFITKGTYDQLFRFYQGVQYQTIQRTNHISETAQALIIWVKDNLFDYEMFLDRIDIHNYLEYKTKDFDIEKCRMIKTDMEFYKIMIIDEEKDEEINKKIDSGWDDYARNGDTGIDYQTTRNNLWGHDTYYYTAIGILKSKLGEIFKQENAKVLNNTDNRISGILQTERVQKIFNAAIKKGWMRQQQGGYDWLGIDGNKRGKQQQFAYLCSIVFDYNNSEVPCKELETAFGIRDLHSYIVSVYKAQNKQKWREPIDELLRSTLI